MVPFPFDSFLKCMHKIQVLGKHSQEINLQDSLVYKEGIILLCVCWFDMEMHVLALHRFASVLKIFFVKAEITKHILGLSLPSLELHCRHFLKNEVLKYQERGN